jgi:uncharacterized protein YcbK (DUF882 family)
MLHTPHAPLRSAEARRRSKRGVDAWRGAKPRYALRMFPAPPARALAGSIFAVALLAGGPASPTSYVEPARARATERHPLAIHEEVVDFRVGPPVAWAQKLEPIVIEYANTGAKSEVRLYRDDGEVDDEALERLHRTMSEGDEAYDLNLRTLQLAFKAAYHFASKKMVIVSARRPGRGPHATGDALDFRLGGVRAAALASYLRGMPRAGVGVYTNPRTQYVHLDARDQSFHWLDASPPGKVWREKALADAKRDARDASWTADADLPR